eukprot:6181257-Pyramimonas_sp.AAC.1
MFLRKILICILLHGTGVEDHAAEGNAEIRVLAEKEGGSHRGGGGVEQFRAADGRVRQAGDALPRLPAGVNNSG